MDSFKGCTNSATISCDCYQWGHRYPSEVINALWEHLSCVIFAISNVKITTEIRGDVKIIKKMLQHFTVIYRFVM